MTNIQNRELIKEALLEAMSETGLIKGLLSKTEAQKAFGFTRNQVDEAIKSGELRATEKKGITSKQLIPREDLIRYRAKIINANNLKIS